MEIRNFLIASYLLGFALSIDTTWIKSFKICANNDQRMSTEDDVEENNTWLGKAKYELTWDCAFHQKHCQFCKSPVKLNEISSSFEELTPGQKYMIEDSWSSDVEEFPVPTKRLVYRGASITEYASCN
ncbi:uncharacterized protein LOC134276452 isoform X2 [Saccostrea cucullata]|uniref:uncharacterized protein LOC134276452 isoform X2 n=1 Tax=Saccostrea cuccullata TaxID=36930 RepID=UPI002ED4D7D8